MIAVACFIMNSPAPALIKCPMRDRLAIGPAGIVVHRNLRRGAGVVVNFNLINQAVKIVIWCACVCKPNVHIPIIIRIIANCI